MKKTKEHEVNNLIVKVGKRLKLFFLQNKAYRLRTNIWILISITNYNGEKI